MKRISLINIVTLLLVWGCNTETFLDLKPESSLVEQNYFKTTGEVETGVLNIYSALQLVTPAEIQLTELRSDNISPANLEGEWAAIENFSETASNDFVNTFWVTSYATLARCNIVLKYLPNVTDATKKAAFEGEAKFVRALTLFNSVRLFGDIPMPLVPVLVNDTEVFKRVSKDVVYEQIIADLQLAEANLPVSWEAASLGRATKGAAQTLLAKVYLTKKDYASAKTSLEKVISSKSYSLLASYANVFSSGMEMNNEIIFAIRYRSSANGEGQGFSYDFSKDGATRGLQPKTDLLSMYSSSDAVRYTTSITGTGATAFVNKFPDASNSGSRRDSGTDWIVLRYADVLLMYSEVLNELGTSPTDALSNLNAIRKRAGLESYTLEQLPDQTARRLAIQNERRVELAFENYRWYDLLRWGIALDAMKKHFVAIGRSVNVADFRLLYPIPQRELDITNGLIAQNPGY
ncbi:putative outer membrane starch-binding protein [Dyadobacter jejuensis]|uniref:Putative outer membrane starch-binding protein n=1 Tax=Dyadobacter jejuensis TaxID=1082580 RepID=A0A316ANU0_9BACT|nr:RagB/SusD family nutrient uptake outer membrane protein [Dyadobacter jejuensis]PWJ58460.1 putative outer membrane starch-binding protein [Dyadobacter jejuensis]